MGPSNKRRRDEEDELDNVTLPNSPAEPKKRGRPAASRQQAPVLLDSSTPQTPADLVRNTIEARLRSSKLLSYKSRRETTTLIAELAPMVDSNGRLPDSAVTRIDGLIATLEAIKRGKKEKGLEASVTGSEVGTPLENEDSFYGAEINGAWGPIQPWTLEAQPNLFHLPTLFAHSPQLSEMTPQGPSLPPQDVPFFQEALLRYTIANSLRRPEGQGDTFNLPAGRDANDVEATEQAAEVQRLQAQMYNPLAHLPNFPLHAPLPSPPNLPNPDAVHANNLHPSNAATTNPLFAPLQPLRNYVAVQPHQAPIPFHILPRPSESGISYFPPIFAETGERGMPVRPADFGQAVMPVPFAEAMDPALPGGIVRPGRLEDDEFLRSASNSTIESGEDEGSGEEEEDEVEEWDDKEQAWVDRSGRLFYGTPSETDA
jgi:hypothetical protein